MTIPLIKTLCGSALALLGPLITLRAQDNPAPLPPSGKDAVVYHNSFTRGIESPEVNSLEECKLFVNETAPLPKGWRGPAATVQCEKNFNGFELRSPALSPHRPLTISFWWALPVDLPVTGGFGLLQLASLKDNGKGRAYVSLFSRGKGEWCALEEPTGVLQVYNFADIRNENLLYDRKLTDTLGLKAGRWHHTAVVFRMGRIIEAYTDGKLAATVTLTGGEFRADQELQDLSFGGGFGQEIWLDEVVIFNRALEADALAAYYKANASRP